MAYSSLAILLMLLAVVAAAAAYICFTLLRRNRVSDPACGACSYRVDGLEGLRCPECGADLRVVGIITSEMTRRLAPQARTVLAVLLFTVLYWLAAVPGATVAREVIDPPRWVTAHAMTPTSDASARNLFAVDWTEADPPAGFELDPVVAREVEMHVERAVGMTGLGTPDYRILRVATRSTQVRSRWFPWVASGVCGLGWLVGVLLIARRGRRASGRSVMGAPVFRSGKAGRFATHARSANNTLPA